MVPTTDGDTARDRADQEYDRAADRFRAGDLSPTELEGVADQIDQLATATDDETARIEIKALGESLRELPELIKEETASAPTADSSLVSEVDALVEWGWEELPTTGARIHRVKEAVARIDQLPPGDVHEQYAVRKQRTQLLDLLAALEVSGQ